MNEQAKFERKKVEGKLLSTAAPPTQPANKHTKKKQQQQLVARDIFSL